MLTNQEILSLEREFWSAMAGGHHSKAAKLIASRAAMVSTHGAHTFSPEDYLEMSEKSPYTIKDWEMSEENVIFPTPETAVITYLVKQTVELGGRAETTVNSDSSVWVKSDGAWKCILHTEAPWQKAPA
jgi:hypothetical protein